MNVGEDAWKDYGAEEDLSSGRIPVGRPSCSVHRLHDTRRAMRYLALAMIFCWLAGCQPKPALRDSSPPAPSDTFKVMTYNTLHGLEVSKFWVHDVESSAQRTARFTARIAQMIETQPDLMLLQEVNPLPHMAEQYVRALKERGLEYVEVHQVDACGLRLAPGLAVLPGLNNGLAILARDSLRLRMVEGIKLSGTFGICGDYAGFQFGELRYALMAEITTPDSGLTYLVATMHLHSGIERDAQLLHDLMEAHRQGLLHHYDHLMAALTMDQQRRKMELHALMDAIQQRQMHQRYAGVIVGGDLNFEPGSPEYQELQRAGFIDSARLAVGMPMWNTYDPASNRLAAHEEEMLPPAFLDAIAMENESDRNEAIKEYRRAISMARRIDFLFSMSFMPTACLTQELIGKPATMRDPSGSDHYGLLNTYAYRRKSC